MKFLSHFWYKILNQLGSFPSARNMLTVEIFDNLKVIEPTKKEPIRKYIPKLMKQINLEYIDKKFKPGFLQQSNTFSKLIKTKKKSDSVATLTDTLHSIEICEKLLGKFTK